MARKIKILVILLFLKLATFSQATLPLIIHKGDTLIGITNEQGIQINKVYLERDKLKEQLDLEKKYSRDKDSIGKQYREVITKMEKVDSTMNTIVVDFKKLSKMQEDKFKYMEESWKDYAQAQKRKAGGIGGTAGAILLLVILGLIVK